ncbi:hypothetical protein [Nitrosopumilus sp.]|uniref:hypothetical protein n=1 Tax=Nitrosopumilus sp. TaxID=2024843 RepID=UPI00292DF9AB|nr:hypothetical protein [Nitrosopumilus sp.]
MKIAKVIIIIGIIMFGTGILLFYSIESGQTDQGLRVLKNTGTFVGLSGIGFVLAGILSYLIYKDNPAVENFGT